MQCNLIILWLKLTLGTRFCRELIFFAGFPSNLTVLFEWNLTERFLQFLRNFSKYQNMQYTIEKAYKIVTKNEKKNLKFSTFVSFLGQFLKKWCFVTLKPVKIFEWNFQQSFLIEIHEKWIHNGWACPPFCACHAHFSKTLIFQKWP